MSINLRMNGTIQLKSNDTEADTHLHLAIQSIPPIFTSCWTMLLSNASPQFFLLSFKTTRQRRLESTYELFMKCHLGSLGISLYSSKMILHLSVKMFTQKRVTCKGVSTVQTLLPFCYNFQTVFQLGCWGFLFV